MWILPKPASLHRGTEYQYTAAHMLIKGVSAELLQDGQEEAPPTPPCRAHAQKLDLLFFFVRQIH